MPSPPSPVGAECLAPPSRWQCSSSFPRPTCPHAHRCSCLTRQHSGEQSGLVTLTFDLLILKVVSVCLCDVGYLCANSGLPRPLCFWLRPDVCNRRQMSDSIIAYNSEWLSDWLSVCLTDLFLWRLLQVRPTFFGALTLLVRWQEGHPGCKNWVLVCRRQQSDRSFACLIAPTAITIFIIFISNNNIQNGDILVLAHPQTPGKMAVKIDRDSRLSQVCWRPPKVNLWESQKQDLQPRWPSCLLTNSVKALKGILTLTLPWSIHLQKHNGSQYGLKHLSQKT